MTIDGSKQPVSEPAWPMLWTFWLCVGAAAAGLLSFLAPISPTWETWPRMGLFIVGLTLAGLLAQADEYRERAWEQEWTLREAVANAAVEREFRVREEARRRLEAEEWEADVQRAMSEERTLRDIADLGIPS